MVFSNLVFIFLFLPVTLFFYFLLGSRMRNYVLLTASLFFYAWGEPKYVLLMLFSIFMNYVFGLVLGGSWDSLRRKQLFLALAIGGNLAILGFFKYGNFLVDNINLLFQLDVAWEPIPLPLGISFFTFQAMSYIIDVYRKEVQAQRNFFHIALYISLFPQLIAGPIVRYNQIAQQIKKRVISQELFAQGIQRFIIGLAKKVLIANQLGQVADTVFATSPAELTLVGAWLGILAYTLQIYFDFSGYSDMAIGLGMMFGFRFLENFNYPYISKSITEFWRRWHISLGQWFKSYVYIPLGGNQAGQLKLYRNLLLVWALTGFWHGASWTFMAWGLYYGLILCLEKMGLESWLKRLWTPLQHMYVLLIVMMGWVFFRADNFSYSYYFIKTLFGFGNSVILDGPTMMILSQNLLVFILGIILSMPVYPWLKEKIQAESRSGLTGAATQLVSTLGYLLLLLLSTTFLVNSTFNPFLYFRF